jgi:hypothetical protein
MKKLIFIGILIVTGLVMLSTTFTSTPIIAQSETENTNMTDTTNTNMTDTTNTNMPENGQISKRN